MRTNSSNLICEDYMKDQSKFVRFDLKNSTYTSIYVESKMKKSPLASLDTEKEGLVRVSTNGNECLDRSPYHIS